MQTFRKARTMKVNDDVTTLERESDFLTVTQPGVRMFLNVTMTIKPERREEFLAALREVLPAVRAEPNCLYIHVGESAAEPGVFVVSEGFKDLVEYRDVRGLPAGVRERFRPAPHRRTAHPGRSGSAVTAAVTCVQSVRCFPSARSRPSPGRLSSSASMAPGASRHTALLSEGEGARGRQ
jgi:antibiotic biosynthesis monooxygenase